MQSDASSQAGSPWRSALRQLDHWWHAPPPGGAREGLRPAGACSEQLIRHCIDGVHETLFAPPPTCACAAHMQRTCTQCSVVESERVAAHTRRCFTDTAPVFTFPALLRARSRRKSTSARAGMSRKTPASSRCVHNPCSLWLGQAHVRRGLDRYQGQTHPSAPCLTRAATRGASLVAGQAEKRP